MLFIQQGASWRPKVELILKHNLADGIIWDIRSEKESRIEEIRKNDSEYSSLKQWFPLKQYYAQFENSVRQKLDEVPEFPDFVINRQSLLDDETFNQLVLNNYNFQKRFDPSLYLTPTFYINNFTDRTLDSIERTWINTANIVHKADTSKEVFASLIISEDSFSEYINMSDFLTDFQNLSEFIDGIYFVIDRTIINSNRHDFNSNSLKNVMNFIYALKNMGFKIAIGYCGIESILFKAVGADYIGTGWFYSLRQFTKEKRGLIKVDSFGRQKKRYTSFKVLSEIPIEDQLFSLTDDLKDKLFPILLDDCEIDKEIMASNSDDEINNNDCYLQYFETLSKHFQSMDALPSYELKLEQLSDILDTSQTNINLYNSENTLNKLSDRHIKSYKSALNDFKEKNYF